MTPERTTTEMSDTFTNGEIHALRSLRTRYQQDLDMFNGRERAHLQFIRWQHQTGLLAS